MSLSTSVAPATCIRVECRRETLEAVTRLDPRGGGRELIVVDSCSTDAMRVVRQAFIPFLYLYESIAGRNQAPNCGIASARGERLVSTGDDVTPDAAWLTHYQAAVANRPDAVQETKPSAVSDQPSTRNVVDSVPGGPRCLCRT